MCARVAVKSEKLSDHPRIGRDIYKNIRVVVSERGNSNANTSCVFKTEKAYELYVREAC